MIIDMLTEKDYCDYETCVALEELGYIGSSRYYYTKRDRKFHYDAYNKFYTVRTADAMGHVLAVHLYDAQKWLREEYGLIVTVVFSASTQTWSFWEQRKEDGYVYRQGDLYPSYEEALSEGVRAAVKLLKEE